MKNFLFLLAKGQISTDTAEIKKYIGIGTCKILAVNPTASQIKTLAGYEPKEEPSYIGVQEINGTKVQFARIAFLIKTDPERCDGIETTHIMSYFVRNQPKIGSQSGKYQVIDEYGRTAWATKEVIEAKGKIFYKEGTMEANITQNYRMAYDGEEELTNFIKTYLNIPNVMNYINGTWVMKSGDEAKESFCRLDEIANYFKGNFSEIKSAIELQPTNKINVLFGINAKDGKEYQDVYTKTVLRNNYSSNTIAALEKEIEDSKNSGGLANRIYELCRIKEYAPVPTDFSAGAPTDDNPFGDAPTGPTPW